MRQPGNANQGAWWWSVGMPWVRHSRVGLHLNECVHVDDEKAAINHIIPGSARRSKLDRQRFHHTQVLGAYVADRNRPIFLIGRSLAGDENQFARASNGYDARVARMLEQFGRIDCCLSIGTSSWRLAGRSA